MSYDYYLGPDLWSLVKRFLLVFILRLGWHLINVHVDYTYALMPVPWGFLYANLNLVSVVDGGLALAQAALIFGCLCLLIIQFWPVKAVEWNLIRREGESPASTRQHSILLTALLLGGLVIFTCCMIAWLVVTKLDVPFYSYLNYAGGIPITIGLGLTLLGWMFGGSYIARASDEVGTSFNISKVSEDHWLALRVKRIADELKLPMPMVATTRVTNAFAMGTSQDNATVVIGEPLPTFEEDELDAIIGHEMGHVLFNDVRRMQFAEGFQHMLNKTISVATVIIAVAGYLAMASQNSRSKRTNANLIPARWE